MRPHPRYEVHSLERRPRKTRRLVKRHQDKIERIARALLESGNFRPLKLISYLRCRIRRRGLEPRFITCEIYVKQFANVAHLALPSLRSADRASDLRVR